MNLGEKNKFNEFKIYTYLDKKNKKTIGHQQSSIGLPRTQNSTLLKCRISLNSQRRDLNVFQEAWRTIPDDILK